MVNGCCSMAGRPVRILCKIYSASVPSKKFEVFPSRRARVLARPIRGNSFLSSGPCSSPVSAGCNVNVKGVPDIGTLVTDGDGVVLVGNNHTYTVEVDPGVLKPVGDGADFVGVVMPMRI